MRSDKFKEFRGIITSLFSRIVICKPDAQGVRKVAFVLKNKTSSNDMEEVFIGHSPEMVEHAGLEPATTRL